MLAVLSSVVHVQQSGAHPAMTLVFCVIMLGWIFLLAGAWRGTFLAFGLRSRAWILALGAVGVIGGGMLLNAVPAPASPFFRAVVAEEMAKLGVVAGHLNRASDIARAANANGLGDDVMVGSMAAEFSAAYRAGSEIRRDVMQQVDMRIPPLLKFVLPRLKQCDPVNGFTAADFADCKAAATEFGVGLEKVRADQEARR